MPAAGWATIPPGSGPGSQTPSEPLQTDTGDDRSPSPRPAEPQNSPPADDVPPPDIEDEPPYEPAYDAPAPTPVPERPTAPTAESPAPEGGELTLPAVQAAWNGILARLEAISRSSWLVLQSARPVEASGDILTLVFTNQGDLATFKHRTPQGGGVSEDLRTVIVDVLGIRVKYLARYEGGPGGGPGRSDGPAGGPTGAPRPTRPEPARGDETPPRSPSPASSPSPTAAPSSYAAAPVTEWAVAAIPGSALAVDDDPEEAVVPPAARVAAPVRDGEVVAAAAAAEEDDDVDPGDVPPEPAEAIAPTPPPVTPAPVVQTRSVGPEGIQRYGEAVVRQVLGAKFLHEEPYEPPTRFQ